MANSKTIEFQPEEEARRLWERFRLHLETDVEDVISKVEAVEVGVRAAEIFGVLRLQPVSEKFPATIQSQLESPPPEVEPGRDASAPPHSLQFVELLDLLSDEEMECVSPTLYRGWEDRKFARQRAQLAAQEACGMKLDVPTRESLLFLAALRNRLFRFPPPLQFSAQRLEESLPILDSFLEKLSQ